MGKWARAAAEQGASKRLGQDTLQGVLSVGTIIGSISEQTIA